MEDTREAFLARTFVTLADSLVSDFDLIELLQTLVDHATQLFDATDAGITLGPDLDHLDVIVSTSEQSRTMELLQVRSGEGPCMEAITTGHLVSVGDTAEIRTRWAEYAEEAERAGYKSVHAIPLRLRGDIIGSFNLFCDREGALDTPDAIAAQALADVATISILQERAIRDSDIVRQQLQRALDSRVTIEQAKGMLAQLHGLDMDAAYRLLRHQSRSTQTPMSDVATGIIDGTLGVALSEPPNC